MWAPLSKRGVTRNSNRGLPRIDRRVRGVRPKANVTVGLLAALSLSGCALLKAAPQLDTYDLTAPAVAAAGARHARTQILIAQPSALKAFNEQHIVIESSPESIEYLKGAQWADRLPSLVQERLAEAFQKSGFFGGVGKPGEGLAIDYQVICDIRAFDITLKGGTRAEVALFVRLLNDRNGTVRASRLFTSATPVVGSGNAAFAAALNRAFGEAVVEIVDWAGRSV